MDVVVDAAEEVGGAIADAAEEIGDAAEDVAQAVADNVRPIVAIAAAAVVTFATGGVAAPAVGGFVFGYISSDGNLKAALLGAVQGVAFAGVGSFATAFGGTASATLAHGVVGGVMSEIQGGDFVSGFASAFIAKSFAAPVDNLTSPALRIVASATLGGIGSKITGGKFSDGAVTGSFSRLFNDEIPHSDLETGEAKSTMTTANIVEFAVGAASGTHVAGKLYTWMKKLRYRLVTPNRYFSRKSKAQVERAMESKFGPPRSIRPTAKTFRNERTKTSYNVHHDPAHMGGKPHVDVRNRHRKPRIDKQFTLKD